MALLWLDDQWNGGRPGIWFAGLLVGVGLLCCLELTWLFSHSDKRLDGKIIGVASLAAMIVTVIGRFDVIPHEDCPLGYWGWSALGLSTSIAIVTVVEMRQFRAGDGATVRMALGLLLLFYVLLPFSFMLHLRMWAPTTLGLLAVASIIFATKFADAGAYFAGRLFGKHPMSPVLSPKKTVEGAIGGFLGAALASFFFFRCLVPFFQPSGEIASLGAIVGFAVTLAGAGMLGDLTISLFKRDVGQKDSAKWLPGLGGCLDVLDSVMWAAPVGYVWWISGLLGG